MQIARSIGWGVICALLLLTFSGCGMAEDYEDAKSFAEASVRDVTTPEWDVQAMKDRFLKEALADADDEDLRRLVDTYREQYGTVDSIGDAVGRIKERSFASTEGSGSYTVGRFQLAIYGDRGRGVVTIQVLKPADSDDAWRVNDFRIQPAGEQEDPPEDSELQSV